MKKKEKKWVRFRHRIIRNIAYAVLGTYVRLKYRVKINKFKNKELFYEKENIINLIYDLFRNV